MFGLLILGHIATLLFYDGQLRCSTGKRSLLERLLVSEQLVRRVLKGVVVEFACLVSVNSCSSWIIHLRQVVLIKC